VVLGDREGHHKIPAPPTLVLDLSARVKHLLTRRDENQIFAVQRTPKPPQPRVLRVPLKNVSYRVGETS
jgi:hypothetical protein